MHTSEHSRCSVCAQLHLTPPHSSPYSIQSSDFAQKLRATIQNEARKLKPEMFARLALPLADHASFIVIPHQAMVEVGRQRLVYVETNPGQYEPREIKAEQVNADQVRVLKGLTVGEHIVARGASAPDKGTRFPKDPLQVLSE